MAFARRSSGSTILLLSLLASLSWAPSANAFYLPGAAPRDYVLDEKVLVHVNRLNPLVGAQDAKLVSWHALECKWFSLRTVPFLESLRTFGGSCAVDLTRMLLHERNL